MKTERELFEAYVKSTYRCTEHSFAKSNGGYYNSVHTHNLRGTPDYAAVSMLWDTWCASTAVTWKQKA